MTTMHMDRSLAGLHILIVEDEAVVGILLEELLEDAGARVCLAHNIGGALAAVQQEVFDGVLLDINLHGVTTSQVADDLVRRRVPFIVVTGYECKDSDTPALKAAPRLLKPFSRAELLRSMSEVFVGAAVA